MMPNYASYSQAWMHRMLESLGDRVGLVAAGDTHAGPPMGRPVFELFRLRRGRRKVETVPALVPWLNRYRSLGREFERRGIDTVLCHFGTLAVKYLPFWESSPVRLFVHFHGFDATFDLRNHDGVSMHPAGYREEILRLSERATFIANSDYCAGMLREAGVRPEGIVRKYLGVPLPPAIPERPVRSPLSIVAVGRLIDCKGPVLTFKAFEKACAQGLDARLTFYGDGPLFEELAKTVLASRYADRVALPGAVPTAEVERALREADIFTQHNLKGPVTHQQEAFGVSILVGWGPARAVGGARAGGVGETVPGDYSCAFPSGDVEGQAERFLRLAAEPETRRAAGEAGYRHVAERFSLDEERRALLAILDA